MLSIRNFHTNTNDPDTELKNARNEDKVSWEYSLVVESLPRTCKAEFYPHYHLKSTGRKV